MTPACHCSMGPNGLTSGVRAVAACEMQRNAAPDLVHIASAVRRNAEDQQGPRSGGGRSAGLERRAARRDNSERDAIDVLDEVGNEWQRQLRRLGGERRAQQRDGRADIAIIVASLGWAIG